MADIVVLTAHPRLEHSRVNLALMQAAQQLPAEHVMVRDLYALYPDYLIDIAAERAVLAKAKLLVWQHPLHWYALPPLLKLWVDEVFGFGWAYGPGSHALRGKDLWMVVSTGGSAQAYHPSGHNRHFIDAFWPPHEQTAMLTGMRFLPPMVVHDAHRVAQREIAARTALFADRLASYPNWPELAELPDTEPCDVGPGDRPQR